MGAPLRRTESFLTLDDLADCASSQPHLSLPDPLHNHLQTVHIEHSVLYDHAYTSCDHIFQADGTASTTTPIVNLPKPRTSVPCPSASPRRPSSSAGVPRCSSPLSPKRTLLPPRAHFPRSRHEPDLYKLAITTRMKSGPEGATLLRMGPRFAFSVMTATRELERIVAAQIERDSKDEFGAVDGGLSNSWVDVGAAQEDWEMINCAS